MSKRKWLSRKDRTNRKYVNSIDFTEFGIFIFRHHKNPDLNNKFILYTNITQSSCKRITNLLQSGKYRVTNWMFHRPDKDHCTYRMSTELRRIK